MLFTALLFGLVSSLHCIGMCGPIATMLPVSRTNPALKTLQLLMYHAGRLSSYGFLGFIFGIIGKGLFIAGFQQKLSIVMGILMITITLIPERIFMQYNFSKPIYKIISSVKSSLGKQLKKKSPISLYAIGVLNGFLPCGLVYAALFGAIAIQSPFKSTVYMIVYGLGTIPMMSLIVYVSHFLSNPIRNKLQKLIPVVSVVIGMLFVMRGLGLDLPYISPSTMNLFVKPDATCH